MLATPLGGDQVVHRFQLPIVELSGHRAPRLRPPLHDLIRDPSVFEVAIGAPLDDWRGVEFHSVPPAVLVTAGDPAVVAAVAHLDPGLTQAPGVVAPAAWAAASAHSSLFRHGATIYTVSAVGNSGKVFVSARFPLCVIDTAGRDRTNRVPNPLRRSHYLMCRLSVDNLCRSDYVYRYGVADLAR